MAQRTDHCRPHFMLVEHSPGTDGLQRLSPPWPFSFVATLKAARRSLMAKVDAAADLARSPDRVLLVDAILPALGGEGGRVLFVGVRAYTQGYPAFLEAGGGRRRVLDPRPRSAGRKVRRRGAARHRRCQMRRRGLAGGEVQRRRRQRAVRLRPQHAKPTGRRACSHGCRSPGRRSTRPRLEHEPRLGASCRKPDHASLRCASLERAAGSRRRCRHRSRLRLLRQARRLV